MDAFLRWYALVLFVVYLAINAFGIHKLVEERPGMADMIMAAGK